MAGVPDRAVAAIQTAFAQAVQTSCPHTPGWKPTQPQLYLILAKHRGWLQKTYPDYPTSDKYLDHIKSGDTNWRREARSHPELANLCYTDLSKATLSQATLSHANLEEANLSHANLSDTNLRFAHLEGANLRFAHLERADLAAAYLEGAVLYDANLTRAVLYDANLTRANLRFAHLEGANLRFAHLERADLAAAYLEGADLRFAHLERAVLYDTQVSKATLAYADLTDATYAPVSEPPDAYVAGIRGLSTLHAKFGEEIGLVQLRKLLQGAGLRDDERAVTYSIERNVTRDQLSSLWEPCPRQSRCFAWSHFWRFAWIGGFLRFVAFDITTAYGLHPTRALGLIVLLGTVLTPVYMRAMLHPTATSGVVQVFPEDRLDGTAGNPAAKKERKEIVVQAKTWRDALRPAVYFSLISAANIGFEQFTPGDWIRRLQGREYSLEAVGWVRKVAGAQALLSVYLLAIWVLTQFGRPFE
jgi:uncharacterized protein YjbI with pentapeptide repeats